MSTILVKHKGTHVGTLQKRFSGYEVIDVSSKGPDPWHQFSPFFPHGEIPIAYSPGKTSQSVEGIWQGLKVFESTDVDPRKFEVTSMRGLKRTVRRFGNVLGHRKGIEGTELLSYRDARYQIYLPAYLWVLENKLQEPLALLRERCESGPVILLDYETNQNIDDLRKPLSHAGLVKRYLEGEWPSSIG